MIGLCERFGCLPEAGGLLDQDAGLLRMLEIQRLGNPVPSDGGG